MLYWITVVLLSMVAAVPWVIDDDDDVTLLPLPPLHTISHAIIQLYKLHVISIHYPYHQDDYYRQWYINMHAV